MPASRRSHRRASRLRAVLCASTVAAVTACTLPESIVYRPRDAGTDLSPADVTSPDAMDAPTLDTPVEPDVPATDAPAMDTPGERLDAPATDVPTPRDAPPDAPAGDACMPTMTGEVCNGRDDNCNGMIDEGNPGGGLPCGSSVGACRPGTTACRSGRIACDGEIGPSPEVCNGIDDNCDGMTDNGACSAMGYCAPAAGRCCNTASAQPGGCTPTNPCAATLSCLDRPGPAHLCCY